MNNEKVKAILEQTRDIYDRIAPDFADTRNKWWSGMGNFARYVSPGQKVLDLGCANGRMAELFADSKIKYLGIDNSAELIKIAQERYRNQSWAEFIVGDAVKLDYADEFDLILLIAVLHHIPTRALRLKVLKDCFRALKPGGRLIISNWNLWQVHSRKKNLRYFKYIFNFAEKLSRRTYGVSDAYVPWKASLPRSQWQLRYVHSFRRGELKRLLKSAGFRIEWIKYSTMSGKASSILTGDNLMAVAVKL